MRPLRSRLPKRRPRRLFRPARPRQSRAPPSVIPYSVVRQGALVVVGFSEAAPIGTPALLPRNVTGFVAGAGEARITVVPGAVVKDFRVDNRIVLDVLNPTSALGAAGDPDPLSAAPARSDLKLATALPMPPPRFRFPCLRCRSR